MNTAKTSEKTAVAVLQRADLAEGWEKKAGGKVELDYNLILPLPKGTSLSTFSPRGGFLPLCADMRKLVDEELWVSGEVTLSEDLPEGFAELFQDSQIEVAGVLVAVDLC